jgi:hypothetical protein
MSQLLPDGATILPAEMDRLKGALVELSRTKNAGTVLTVKVNLHVHYEYPKHMTLNGDTVVVNNAIEEAHVAAGRKPNHKHSPIPTKAQLESIGKKLPKAA